MITKAFFAKPFRLFGRRMSHWARPCITASTLAALTLGAQSAAAEEPPTPPDPLAPGDERPLGQSGYAGDGSVASSFGAPGRLRVGDFVLGGEARFDTVYDDNVEADDDERDEDVFLIFSPSVRAESTYARHGIGLEAGSVMGTALKDSADDFLDWRVGADGRIDLSRTSRIDAAAAYRRDSEDDEDIDVEDDDGDTSIDSIAARLGYRIDGKRLGFGVEGDVSRLDFDDDDFDDRDRTAYRLNGRMRYRWSDALILTGGPGYRRSVFDEDVAGDGEGRDASEYSFQLGAGFRASRTINTRASLGYARVEFDDSGREDDDSITGNAGLTWSPGGGTTLDLQASRTLELSVQDGEDSRERTSAFARLAQRLLQTNRSLLLASLRLGVDRLSDLDRTDGNLITGLSYGYRLADHAVFTAGYRYSQRFSDDDDADYYRNVVSIGVTLSY